MIVVPAAHNASVVILIIVFIMAACTAVAFIFMLFVTFSVSVPVTLGPCKIASEDEKPERAGEYPFCRFHFSLQSEGD
jgi:flagellar basal body-associated protein FliL